MKARILALALALTLVLTSCVEVSVQMPTGGNSSSTGSTTSSTSSASDVSNDSNDPNGSNDSDDSVSSVTDGSTVTNSDGSDEQTAVVTLANLPDYTGTAYVEVNDNVPYFTEDDLTTEAFETFAPLDNLGRCGVTYANVCIELMPTEKRGNISSVHPTGWQSVQYDFVDGKNLYNRCHLIGFQLTGENANKQNLITGTRYLNVIGMLPFEDMVADYVKETEQHVLYRVTPIFEGDELVARGVLMEGYSVEDEGEGVCFNVYCYNVQPNVTIDYATGKSWETQPDTSSSETSTETYVLNTNGMKFHLPDCASVSKMSEANKKTVQKSRDDLIAAGYSPCGSCNS